MTILSTNGTKSVKAVFFFIYLCWHRKFIFGHYHCFYNDTAWLYTWSVLGLMVMNIKMCKCICVSLSYKISHVLFQYTFSSLAIWRTWKVCHHSTTKSSWSRFWVFHPFYKYYIISQRDTQLLWIDSWKGQKLAINKLFNLHFNNDINPSASNT